MRQLQSYALITPSNIDCTTADLSPCIRPVAAKSIATADIFQGGGAMEKCARASTRSEISRELQGPRLFCDANLASSIIRLA